MESLISKDNPNKIEGLVFLPCPDKDSRQIHKMIERYIENTQEIKEKFSAVVQEVVHL